MPDHCNGKAGKSLGSSGDMAVAQSTLTNAKTLCQPETVTRRVDLSGRAFSDVDRTGDTDFFISYLDKAKEEFARVKSVSCGLLRLQSGEKVLDEALNF